MDEQQERAAIVAIGRNVGDEPMDGPTWARFIWETVDTVDHWADTFYSRTEGRSEGSADWGPEDTAVVVFGIRDAYVPDLRAGLGKLARKYGQDAIALTLGETEFVRPRR